MTLKDYLNAGDRFAANCGARLTEVAPGSAVAVMEVTQAHLNAGDVCQGGAIFTLADLVFAALVNQGGVRIATFTGQAYTGRSPLPVDALQ